MPLTVRPAAATWLTLALTAALLSGVAVHGDAQNTCSATGQMAGEKFMLTHCAASVSPEDRSVTIWFNETPITDDERDGFQLSAYAGSLKDGTPRTMVLAAFCPGGGAATASAAAVKKMDLGLNHAGSPMAGAQWVIEAPKEFEVRNIAGGVEPGGKLTGQITGQRSVDGRPYSWDFTFDLVLPTQGAASGITCSP